MKNCRQIKLLQYIYISFLNYHSKRGTLITFQSYFNCIETKQDSFGGSRIIFSFLIVNYIFI